MSAASTVYSHPDGPKLAFKDNQLTATGEDGQCVVLPIGPRGLVELAGELSAIGKDSANRLEFSTLRPFRAANASPKLVPRQMRVVLALLRGPVMREEIDRVAGASNGPDVVARLRAKGLDIPCTPIDSINRDGEPCRPGQYELSSRDRETLLGWVLT